MLVFRGVSTIYKDLEGRIVALNPGFACDPFCPPKNAGRMVFFGWWWIICEKHGLENAGPKNIIVNRRVHQPPNASKCQRFTCSDRVHL